MGTSYINITVLQLHTEYLVVCKDTPVPWIPNCRWSESSQLQHRACDTAVSSNTEWFILGCCGTARVDHSCYHFPCICYTSQCWLVLGFDLNCWSHLHLGQWLQESPLSMASPIFQWHFSERTVGLAYSCDEIQVTYTFPQTRRVGNPQISARQIPPQIAAQQIRRAAGIRGHTVDYRG